MLNNLINRFTMYRIILYSLYILVITGFLNFPPLSYLTLLLIIISTSFLFHQIFTRLFRSYPNQESWLITALILILILDIPRFSGDYLILVLASFLAQASKYILAYKKVHLFNPAAFASFTLGLLGFVNSSWWIGSRLYFLPVFFFGILILSKTKKFPLFFAFSFVAILISILRGIPPAIFFLSGPFLFFATFMLTEPLTAPISQPLQILYGLLVGFLFFKSPEIALLTGNFVFFLVNRRQRYVLTFVSKQQVAINTYNFLFSANPKPQFSAGQYMEWTIPHHKPDSRGNRRWFTLASSPKEKYVHLGLKLPSGYTSSLKRSLFNLAPGRSIIGHQIAGDFILQKDPKTKLAFLAGGIGITPFRSMLKYLSDTNDKSRDIILLYVNNGNSFAYQNIFNPKKTIYYDSTQNGYLTAKKIKKLIPDYSQRVFYLSGPKAMVDSYKQILKKLGVFRFKTDYFPGF